MASHRSRPLPPRDSGPLEHPGVCPGKDGPRRAAAGLLWSRTGLPPAETTAADRRAAKGLLARLSSSGLRGNPAAMTLSTRTLSPGCRNCLQGRGVSLRMTTRCTRACFYCFNPNPRKGGLRLESVPVRGFEEMLRYIRRNRLLGAGISGGDPLTCLGRTLGVIRSLRRSLGPGFYIHLYTNGDLATAETLGRLKAAGLDGLRFNLDASGWSMAPVRRALEVFKDVSVEVPVVPGREARLRRLILDLDAARVPHLNLHELCYSLGNKEAFSSRGFSAKPSPAPAFLEAMPVAGSEEAALRLLVFALERTKRLSVFYCSWTTQERVINPAGWRWRERARREAVRTRAS